MAIRVNFALSEQKIHQNISKKQNQNSLLLYLHHYLHRVLDNHVKNKCYEKESFCSVYDDRYIIRNLSFNLKYSCFKNYDDWPMVGACRGFNISAGLYHQRCFG